MHCSMKSWKNVLICFTQYKLLYANWYCPSFFFAYNTNSFAVVRLGKATQLNIRFGKYVGYIRLKTVGGEKKFGEN